jgi:hypothetical protein
MKNLPCIVEAQPAIHGVLDVKIDDGHRGAVDLRPLVAKGKVFASLRAPERFATVRIDKFGHLVSWLDDQGYSIDPSADWSAATSNVRRRFVA